MSDLPVFFRGELQFRRYSDTSTQGQQVVFALADREALAPFIGKEGKRFACMLIELGDDEQPVQQPPKAEPEKPKGGPLARLAGQWCNDPAFVEWLRRTYSASWNMARELHPDDAPDEWAAWIVRDLCGIASRAQLDSDADAADRFQRQFRRPYMATLGG